MKKVYIFLLLCLVALSYFGTKLLEDYTNRTTAEALKKRQSQNAPVLTLVTDEMNAYKGFDFVYDELVAEAYDEEDGNLIDKVTHNMIDIETIGEQELIFSVTDSDGNTTKRSILVTINEADNLQSEDTEEPLIQN